MPEIRETFATAATPTPRDMALLLLGASMLTSSFRKSETAAIDHTRRKVLDRAHQCREALERDGEFRADALDERELRRAAIGLDGRDRGARRPERARGRLVHQHRLALEHGGRGAFALERDARGAAETRRWYDAVLRLVSWQGAQPKPRGRRGHGRRWRANPRRHPKGSRRRDGSSRRRRGRQRSRHRRGAIRGRGGCLACSARRSRSPSCRR